MIPGEIELAETELLLLQYLLDGNNFGISFDNFRNENVNAAQFTTDERGNLYRTRIVERAREGGRLSELHFRLEVNPEDDSNNREIKVVVNREGYFRTRQTGPTDLLDRFMGNLRIVLEYRDKLIPLDDRIDSYIHKKSSPWDSNQTREIMETKRAFKELVEEYFDSEEFSGEERGVHESIVANIGIQLAKLDLTSDEYPDIDDFDGGTLDYRGKISSFYRDFLVHEEGVAPPDFDVLAGHIFNILRRTGDFDSLIDLLEYAEATYDI